MTTSSETTITIGQNEDAIQTLVTTTYKFQVEKFRLIAYVAFWFMCFFAMAVTSLAVAPNLGPCPNTEGAEPSYGLHCSVLVKNFGFNNVSRVIP